MWVTQKLVHVEWIFRLNVWMKWKAEKNSFNTIYIPSYLLSLWNECEFIVYCMCTIRTKMYNKMYRHWLLLLLLRNRHHNIIRFTGDHVFIVHRRHTLESVVQKSCRHFYFVPHRDNVSIYVYVRHLQG